jgi:hypothetical protein
MTMYRFGFSRVFLAAALISIGAASVSRAAGDDAEEHAARKACLSGNYQKGVEILSDLFISTKNPVHIYNQARCYEQNGRCEDAIPRFREYLRKAEGASTDDRVETEKHITDCQALLGQKPTVGPALQAQRPATSEVATERPPTREVTASSPPAPSADVPKPQPVDRVITSPFAPALSTGRGLRIAGIGCGVLGVVSVATGFYFYTRARSYSDKVSNQTPPNSSDDSAGKNAETMQWVFYSVGGAALATGVVLYALGWPSEESNRSAAQVAPILGHGFAGLSAQGAF